MAKKKTKKDKRSRVSLRVDTPVHARLAKVARSLGLDINGVMSLMLTRWLPQVELEAYAYKRFAEIEDELLAEAMEAWKDQNPGRHRKDFQAEYIKMLMGEPSSVSKAYDPVDERLWVASLPDVDGPVTVASLSEPMIAPSPPSAHTDGDDF